MRKHILLLLFLCVQISTQAQTKYRYWFDGDDAMTQEGTTNQNEWQMDLDVSGLTESLHQLHIQVVGDDGKPSSPVTRWFVKFVNTASPTCHAVYWFDDNAADAHRLATPEGKFDIDVSALPDGVHTLVYQLRDEKETPLSQFCSLFVKTSMISSGRVRYWVDNDYDKVQSFAYDGNTHILSVPDMFDGLHMLHIQAEGDSPSAPMTKMFIKIPQTEGIDKLTCLCSIDGELKRQEDVACSDGVLNWIMDVTDIPYGFHHIMLQVLTPTGAGSSLYEGFFLRDITSAEHASMKCVYSVDGGEHKIMAGNLGDGVFHFDLDVTDIKDGLHNISYMLIGDNGISSSAKSAFFWKTPVGGNGVVQYSYWLNDQSEKHEVKLSKRTNPFELISLVPVDEMPVRSSCFDFKVENGQPVVHPKNDIHFEFVDASGFVSTVNAQYVDGNVTEKVTDIAELESTQTFVRPDKNAIKWFSFQSEEGDTIAFKSSQATSIQVFSSDGEEIYSASGDKSVKYDGCHTWEDGTYYVAVHDVTGSQPNVTLDYMHLARYDVVDQDVRVVGNGGCSTVTFRGNGFKDLYAVELYNAQGDTIHSIDIGHESDASTTVTFDFSGAGIGVYSTLFHFTEKDKTVGDNIIVEEAQDIELATTVSYPSTFLRGTATTYTVKITNKGNMTAYYVPIYTYISSRTFEGVSAIHVEGVNKYDFLKNVTDTLPKEQLVFVDDIRRTFSDKALFWHSWQSDGADSVLVRSNYLFTDIAPKETKVITVSLTSTETCDVWFTVPSDWSPLINEVSSDSKLYARRTNGYCCMADKLECGLNLLANLSDWLGPLVPTAAGCGIAAANTALPLLNSGICGGRSAGQIGRNFIASAPSLALSCIPMADWLRWGASASYDALLGAKTLSDCGSAFMKKKPDCPPDPPKGGPSDPVNSLDPNDIFGYTAESGSHFLPDSISAVNYRIEFENDTAFATASAHVVEIKDTLDGSFFDLSSYAPTSIKIGEKTEYLDGSPNFVKTIDMRPAINAIAQVEGKYDQKKGIAIWLFTSIDPMTMEPTDDVMQGFLPVNYDGTSGIGEVAFDIKLRERFVDGTVIPNQASIVFDSNEPIMTPTWTNTVDAVAPVSKVTEVVMKNDSTFTINFEGEDNLSGVWRYDVYYRWKNDMDWIRIANGCDTTAIDKAAVEGYTYQFCVVATDSAGNVEQKSLIPEIEFYTGMLGDVNNDGVVTVADVSGVVSLILEEEGTEAMNAKAADVNRDGQISVADASGVVSIILGMPLESRMRRGVAAVEHDDSVVVKPVDMELDATVEVPIYLHGNSDKFTSMQFDLELPQGVSLVGVKSVNEHLCAYSKTGSRNRVVCLSQENSPFVSADDHLVTLTLKATTSQPIAGEMLVENMELVTPKLKQYHPCNVAVRINVGGATGIDGVMVEEGEQSVYDLNGRRVKDAQNGVYIKDGKSVLVK